MRDFTLEIKENDDYTISCPKCNMISQHSGKFEKNERVKCPWCFFLLEIPN